MKKNILLGAFVALFLMGCNKKETSITEETTITADTLQQQTNENASSHNAQNSLDWWGTYQATLPCADCPGINTTITLNKDETFKYVAEYLETSVKIEETGNIMWHDDGLIVHLKGKDIDTKLKVVENGLVGLDTSGNEIEGPLKEHYNFKKVN